MTRKDDGLPTVQFRCPASLFERLREEAERDGRYLSQQVAWIVRQHFERQDAQKRRVGKG